MRNIKKVLSLLLVLLLALAFAACGESEKPAPAGALETTAGEPETADAETAEEPEESAGEAGGLDEDELPIITDAGTPVEETGSGHELHHVQIVIRDYGTVSLELDATVAPITVQNFLDLAGSGFYDGLTFHRIMDGFMIQGGDPLGNGTGGSGTNIQGEFLLNGWDNTISHKAGVISMARAQPYNSASSQFFICVADSEFLDGQYAAFGWVADEESLAIVQQIAKDARPIDNNGTIPAAQQPVIESVTVLD